MKRKFFQFTLFFLLMQSIRAFAQTNLLEKLLYINKRYKHNGQSEENMPPDWTNANNICVSGSNCFLKQPFHGQKKINLLLFGEISLLQSIDCPCLRELTFACGSEFCTSDESTCLSLMHLRTKVKLFEKASSTWKSCNNSNITIKANLFNYRLRF